MKGYEGYLERASLTWSKNSVRLIETASQTAKDTYFYIQEAGYFETYYPYFTERQNLHSFLLICTISGKGYLRYEGKEYTLEKGQLFFINCLNYHYYESSKEKSWEFLWIHFLGPNVLHYYEEMIKNGFSVLSLEDSFFMESSLRRIISLHQRKDVHRELITSSLITQILTEIVLLNVPSEYLSHNVPAYVNKIKQKLNNEYKNKISLDALALEFSINKFHMSKTFRKYTGTTINEYLIDQRISHAKELLKYSDLSVSEIAFQCGIQNVSHFINLFRDREGKTPFLYRKDWK